MRLFLPSWLLRLFGQLDFIRFIIELVEWMTKVGKGRGKRVRFWCSGNFFAWIFVLRIPHRLSHSITWLIYLNSRELNSFKGGMNGKKICEKLNKYLHQFFLLEFNFTGFSFYRFRFEEINLVWRLTFNLSFLTRRLYLWRVVAIHHLITFYDA